MFLSLFVFCLLTRPKADPTPDPVPPPDPRIPIPTVEHLQYQRKSTSVFIHFNMNTFHNTEVGTGDENPDDFFPENLDTDQWIRAIKNAGFDKVILTAKHHDGFCLWRTNTTAHSVVNSVRFNKVSKSGDVLADIRKSCDKFGVGLGIYLSPWDKNSSLYGTDEYNKFYMEQLKEILTNYGEIKELWMDNYNGGPKKQPYKWLEIFDFVHNLQPNCQIASSYASDIRWIGNELGTAPETCYYTVNSTRMREFFDQNDRPDKEYIKTGSADGDVYSPPEVDFTLQLDHQWFWSEEKGKQLRKIDSLVNVYFESVGRGQIMLMNVSPNDKGLLPDNVVDLVSEFGRSLNQSFGRNYANQSMAAAATLIRGRDVRYDPRNMLRTRDPQMYWTMNDGMYTGYTWFDFTKPIIFDVISLTEHLELGQRVTKFQIDVEQDGFWKVIGHGTTVGSGRMFRFKPMHAQKIYIRYQDAIEVPCIESFGLFKMQNAFELGQFIPLRIFKATDVSKEGKWENDDENNFTSEVGASYSAKFTGSYCSIVGPIDPEYGEVTVYLDGKKYGSFNAKHHYHRDRRELFRIEYIESGEHTVKVECTSSGFGVYNIYYLENYEIGLFELTEREFNVNKGEELEVEIRRLAGSKTKVDVTLKTDYFTAIAGKHFETFKQAITFDEGETSKKVTIKTINYDADENLSFNIVLEEPTLGSETGFNYSAMVNIIGSPYTPPDPTSKPEPEPEPEDDSKAFLIAGIVLAIISLVLIVVLIVVLCRRRNTDYDPFNSFHSYK